MKITRSTKDNSYTITGMSLGKLMAIESAFTLLSGYGELSTLKLEVWEAVSLAISQNQERIVTNN